MPFAICAKDTECAMADAMPDAGADGGRRPADVGILAIETHFPAFFVDQQELERFDGVGTGKYTIGLGQQAMSFPGDREDVNALALTVVARLLEKYDVDPRAVGRLEVGTETLVDKAKSTKTELMALFEAHGNTDIEGATTINACYGGTAALLNAVAWVESSGWDGRFALVVAADIAVYERGPARPSGGCGAVAMLVGPNAPLVLDCATKTSHATNVWDFYKPSPTCEFPSVDGRLSLAAYLHALDECYTGFCTKSERKSGGHWDLSRIDYTVFHSPFNKQVQKSLGRLVYLDFIRGNNKDDPLLAPLAKWATAPLADTLKDRDLDLAARSVAKPVFKQKTHPSCTVSQQVGNCYAASVYVNLASLVHTIGTELVGKRILLFSYGSGSIATMFAIRARRSEGENEGKFSLDKMVRVLDFQTKLADRIKKSPEEYTAVMALRERVYISAHGSVELTQPISTVGAGAYYLERIDNRGIRHYARHNGGARHSVEADGVEVEERSSLDVASIVRSTQNLSGAVYIAGTSAGIPGHDMPFSDTVVDTLMRGSNCIELVSDQMKDKLLELNIVHHRKIKNSNGEVVIAKSRIEKREECIQVAAIIKPIDLSAKEYCLPAAIVRGMDQPTQLAVAAGLNALKSAKLVRGVEDHWQLRDDLRDSTGVIYATSYPTMNAAVSEVSRFYREGQQAFELDRKILFRLLVLANAQLAQIVGARGPNTQVNAACAGTSQAIAMAQDWITTGKCDRVVVIASDCASSSELFPWIGGGFRVLGASSIAPSVDQASCPFDVKRNGMIVGAGAVGVVVEAPKSFVARSPVDASKRVKLLTSYFSNSAYHGASLDPTHVSQELSKLFVRVEKEFGISRAEFAAHGVYYSHETGTNASAVTSCAYTEVTALRATLGEELLGKLLIANTKGFTGHPMAVSFEDVIAVEGLRRGVVPPVVNFHTHDTNLGESPLNLARGGAYPHKYALRFAAGFGSQLAFTFYALEG